MPEVQRKTCSHHVSKLNVLIQGVWCDAARGVSKLHVEYPWFKPVV